jgi:DNA-binding MarR family transcriptional regulator
MPVNVSKSPSSNTYKSSSTRGGASPAFLLAQVGAHAAAKFAERLSVLNLSPPHAGILRVVDTSGGISQQSLAEHLRILPSRLVVLIDELEERGMVERRADPADRRSYALHLTNKGRDTMKGIGRVARDHQDAFWRRSARTSAMCWRRSSFEWPISKDCDQVCIPVLRDCALVGGSTKRPSGSSSLT